MIQTIPIRISSYLLFHPINSSFCQKLVIDYSLHHCSHKAKLFFAFLNYSNYCFQRYTLLLLGHCIFETMMEHFEKELELQPRVQRPHKL